MLAKPLILCAQAAGYGPAAKLLAVAERLRPAGIRPLFLATGVAHELVSRSSDLGDAVEAAPDDALARAVMRDASAVLSVMDADYARLALDLSRPLHVVDSLSWMRRPMPPEFLSARRYWVQDFPGVREHLHAISPRPTVVGPIMTASPPARTEGDPQLVVNLGGFEGPYGDSSDDSGYAEFVVQGIIDAGLPAAYPGNAVLMAGARCTKSLAERFGGQGLRFVSLSHREAGELRAGATVILTAPGMTSTLEGFRSGTPTFFLPPQNYSQWWILSKLRAAGVAPCAFHWADRLPAGAVAEGLTLDERVPVVREAIAGLTGDEVARRCFRVGLADMLSWPKEQLARAQHSTFRRLGPDGALAVATGLIAEVNGRRRVELGQRQEGGRT